MAQGVDPDFDAAALQPGGSDHELARMDTNEQRGGRRVDGVKKKSERNSAADWARMNTDEPFPLIF